MIRPLRLLLFAAALAAAPAAGAQVAPPPGPTGSVLAEADRVAIAEAMRVSALVGDSLWPGWSELPLALLLVTSDTEFLIGHPRPSADFQPAGDDPALGPILARPRVFPPNLLATFPPSAATRRSSWDGPRRRRRAPRRGSSPSCTSGSTSCR